MADSALVFRSPLAGNSIKMPAITLHEFILQNLEEIVQEHGDSIFLKDVSTGQTITRKEVLHRARSVASGLKKRGFQKGDIFCMYCSNIIDYHVVILAVWVCGGCLATSNPHLTADELVLQLRDSEASMLLCDQESESRGMQAASQCSSVSTVFSAGGDENCVSLRSLTEDDGEAFPSDVQVDLKNDVILVFYSSGTTGKPKGIMHTNNTMLAMFYPDRLTMARRTGQYTSIITFCFYHMSGFIHPLNMLTIHSGPIYCMSASSDERLLEAIQEHKPMSAAMYPPQVHMLARSPLVDKFDLTSLKMVFTGGAILSKKISQQVQGRLHVEVAQAYGMTECGKISVNMPSLQKRFNIEISAQENEDAIDTACVGLPAEYAEIKVIDLETGTALGPNKEGEICVKTPGIMKGYLNKPRETAEVMDEDGFLHTGDLGFYDVAHRLYIIDRLKDMLKFELHHGSLTIPTAVLESIMLNHPDVLDAAVVGVLNDQYVEVPRACIVRRGDSDVTEEELMRHVDAQVSDHMKLRGGVVFLETIPRNTTGKVMKYQLKASSVNAETGQKSSHP